MEEQDMTPAAWGWVGVIAVVATIGAYYALRGLMLAFIWAGGAS